MTPYELINKQEEVLKEAEKMLDPSSQGVMRACRWFLKEAE